MDAEPLRLRWQYCRTADNRDITNELYAEEDADEVRAWEGSFVVLSVQSVQRNQDGTWSLDATDGCWPDGADEHTFHSPVAALDWLAEENGFTYVITDEE